MQEKKIVLFLVEGTSDIEALENNFEEIYEKYNIEFKPLKCDITADESSTRRNIESLLMKKVDEFLSRHLEIREDDILGVVQIVDMDGAGIPSENIKQSENNKTTYTEQFIFAKDKTRLVARNLRKRSILCYLKEKEFLEKFNKDGECEYRLKYHIYYFSRNLEHALYGKSEEYTKEEKEEFAMEFADRFEGNEDEFIKYLSSSDIIVQGKYKETWDFIFSELNSLRRGSNLHLVFEEIPFI